ncbi:thermonuclease family protein [Verrucomicrobia bacterium]|nr:thermonuclease family protein [Verrucomicrobiota bacterium]
MRKLLSLILLSPLLVGAFEFTAKVVGVTDGDTITVLRQSTQHKIRLMHIDAPEGHQAFGVKSKQALSNKVFGKVVTIRWAEHDRYKRILDEVYISKRHINAEMVTEGMAWHYKQYSKDKGIAQSELKARAAKTGLWADKNAIAPWDFRRGGAVKQPNNPAANNAVFVTATGKKYHREGCRFLSKSKIPIPLQRAIKAYGACSKCAPPTK